MKISRYIMYVVLTAALVVGLTATPVITLIMLLGFALLCLFNKKFRYKLLLIIYEDTLDIIELFELSKRGEHPILSGFFLISILLFLLYMYIPKSSWVALNADFDTYDMADFYGEYNVTTNSIDVNHAEFYNTEAIVVTIGEQEYKCEDNEFRIRFPGEEIERSSQKSLIEDYSFISWKEPSASRFGIFPNWIRFSDDVFVYSNINVTKADAIRVERYSDMYEGKPDFYVIYISSRSDNDQVNGDATAYNRTQISIKNGTSVWCPDSCEVTIKDRVIDTREQEIAVFNSTKNKETSHFTLQSERIEFYYLSPDRNSAYISGDCQVFDVKARNSGELKRTYLNSQQTYDIGLLDVTAKADSPAWEDHFKMIWELREDNNVQFSGLARSVAIVGREINFNPIVFLYENFSAICLATFGVIITAYADRILKSKESASDET